MADLTMHDFNMQINPSNSNINFRQGGVSSPAPNLIDNSIKQNANITPLQADSVEISTHKNKKKQMSGLKRFLISMGIIAGSGLVVLKGGHIYMKSTLKKALQESHLKEHIDFKIANTIEEAREFSAKEFGIKDVDKDIPLEVLNYINSELVMVCNANKGKLVIPKRIVYQSLDEHHLAQATNWGDLYLNKSKLEPFREQLTLFQKIRQASSYTDVSALMNETKSKEILKKYYGDTFDTTLMSRYYDDIRKNTSRDILSFLDTIGHEDGHLNDFYKNIETLLKQFSFKNYLKQIFTKKPILDNRWGTINDKYYKELFKNKPEEFKKQCPDLYEFLSNEDIQQTAGEVSDYAKVGIGEFIAETYSKLLKKEKLSDKVMALYKKYNGPMPNA